MRIEAYFSGIKRANEVVQKLKDQGINNVFSDINDHYVLDNNTRTNVPGTDMGPSLAGLVLNSGEPLDNPRLGPIAAASPMASGMGGFEEIADVSYKVVIDIEEKDKERVRNIVTENGGELGDPNFKVPKGLEDVSFDKVLEQLEDY